MSGYLSGPVSAGVQPGDLYQDWAIITVSGADALISTLGSWITLTGLTYSTLAKSSSASYGTSTALTIPTTGHWRIHMRPNIINGTSELFYGLNIGGTFVTFGVATGGSNQVQGNETLVRSITAGTQIQPAVYQISGSSTTWLFTSALTMYLELLKPAI